MKNVAILGSGTIAETTVYAFLEKSRINFNIILISRNSEKNESIKKSCKLKYDFNLVTYTCDVERTSTLVGLIEINEIDLVLNLTTPDTHLSVMKSCIATKTRYIDTALYEHKSDFNVSPPWYQEEYKLKDEFHSANLTALLSLGFDPGVVNCFCAKAAQDDLDEVTRIDIVCANIGSHSRFFATNFNPSVNLKELCEETSFRENGQWFTAPPFSRTQKFLLPALGEQELYSVGHEEVHSLAQQFPKARIEFWMRVGNEFRSTLSVLEKIGFLSREALHVRGVEVAPIDVLSALMPEPAALSADYRGLVCVGSYVQGTHNGQPRAVFYHSICSHEACIADLGAHVTAYTTALPLVAAAELIASGDWDVGRMVHPEELDPTPFLSRIKELGIGWSKLESIMLPTTFEGELIDISGALAHAGC